jgi:hypothetical protein
MQRRGQLIEEYRKTVRSLYNAYYGEDSLKNPTSAEWVAYVDLTHADKWLACQGPLRAMLAAAIERTL